MSAPIVYEGKLQGHGGTLFKDIKFWVAQRVPMRTTWIQNIENNGGSIVKLDKQADFMIADHAKKDSPSGSYSWKWIEDSVKHGKLMDKEDYVITTPGHESRPVGSVQHKSTRNAFTKEDDLLLAKFVAKHEREGTATSGNVIYKQLEAKYPHHTFQSWRDRWVKKLQFAPRPQLSSNSPSPPPERVPAPVSTQPQLVSRAPAQTPQSSKRAEPGNSSSPRKKTRTKFTEEEDKVLLAHVEAMKAEGQGVSGKKAYEGLAHDFPQHTWQAWRDRYLKILRPRELHETGEESPHPSPVRVVAPPVRPQELAPVARQGLDDANTPGPDIRKHSPIARDIEESHPEDASIESQEDAEDQQQYDSDVPFNERVETGNQNAGLDATLATQKSPEKGAGLDLSPITSPKLGQEIGYSSPATTQGQAFLIETKETFHEFFTDFLETETQIDPKDVTFWPTIHGQMFELWDLWRVVQSQKVEPAERDWQQIAEDLGFNWTETPAVPDEIRHYYESRLSSFEEMLLGYVGGTPSSDDEDGDSEEEEEDVEPPESQLPKLPAAQNVLSDSQFNSSPPKQPSLKRAYGATLSAELAYPDSARKRSRLGRDDEIPSTPDNKNGTSHLRPPVSAGVSPSDRRLHALPRSSQSIHSDSRQQAELEFQEIENQFLGLSARLNSRRVVFEPETQDFGFDPQTQRVEDLQQQFEAEVTPTQQLLSEIDAEERRRESIRISPTRKRKVKSPFLPDADDDDEEAVIPKPRYGKGPNPLRSQPELLKPHRRSLPASFIRNHSPAAPPSRKSLPRPSHNSTQVSSTPARPSPRPRSKAEELAQVVEYWQSLGYSHDVARRSLEATTWEPGLAGRIMQYLKDGNPMPTNWEGVWSPRDDESLRLINSANPPNDEQEARKRRKAAARLKNKHGDDRIELRKKWLVVKAEL